MFRKPSKAAIVEAVQKRPGEMFVTNKFLAVAMPDGKVLIIRGDFKDVTALEANTRLQTVLDKLNG